MKELSPDNSFTPIYLQVVSNTPGRVRLRFYQQHLQAIEQIARSIAVFFPQVDRVKTNSQAGTITIYYSGRIVNFEDVQNKLQALGIVLTDALIEKPQLPRKLTSVLSSLSEQVKQTTKETMDLRVLVLYAAVVIALRRVLPQAARWKTTALYLLLWYVLESLVKLSDKKESSLNNQ
ncbi:HMA2 domain-containing protein [Chlorogloeopsis sp. ULAP02]|uniref:HMA2 domain-containing protein n=1 Tax=Chlorogloeopsis sp. ULAP02 TaxID=3107926 RepID=UPI003136E7AC